MRNLIVEEIRQTRDAHAKQFNYDLDAIRDALRKREKRNPACQPSRCLRNLPSRQPASIVW